MTKFILNLMSGAKRRCRRQNELRDNMPVWMKERLGTGENVGTWNAANNCYVMQDGSRFPR